MVEDGLPSDPTEQLPDIFLNLVLSFNLHHTGEQSRHRCGGCRKKRYIWLHVTFLLIVLLCIKSL